MRGNSVWFLPIGSSFDNANSEIQAAIFALTAAAPHGTHTRFPFHRPLTADTNSV